MTSGFESAINDMLAELSRQQETMTRLHTGMKTIRGTAVSPKRQLSVVVDARSKVTELKFLTQAYRTMSGQELASLIVATIEEAQRDAQDKVAAHVGVPGVAGLDVGSALNGDIDWQSAFQYMSESQQPLLDLLARPPASPAENTEPTPREGPR